MVVIGENDAKLYLIFFNIHIIQFFFLLFRINLHTYTADGTYINELMNQQKQKIKKNKKYILPVNVKVYICMWIMWMCI